MSDDVGGADFAGCLAGNLRAAARVVTRAYDAALRPHGVRITQVAILTTVRRLQPVTTTRLAARPRRRALGRHPRRRRAGAQRSARVGASARRRPGPRAVDHRRRRGAAGPLRAGVARGPTDQPRGHRRRAGGRAGRPRRCAGGRAGTGAGPRREQADAGPAGRRAPALRPAARSTRRADRAVRPGARRVPGGHRHAHPGAVPRRRPARPVRLAARLRRHGLAPGGAHRVLRRTGLGGQRRRRQRHDGRRRRRPPPAARRARLGSLAPVAPRSRRSAVLGGRGARRRAVRRRRPARRRGGHGRSRHLHPRVLRDRSQREQLPAAPGASRGRRRVDRRTRRGRPPRGSCRVCSTALPAATPSPCCAWCRPLGRSSTEPDEDLSSAVESAPSRASGWWAARAVPDQRSTT